MMAVDGEGIGEWHCKKGYGQNGQVRKDREILIDK
jgi:hypothetical protein